MRSILIDLYRGNCSGLEGEYDSSSEYNIASVRREKLEADLLHALPDEQKSILEDYTKTFYKMNDLCCEQDFIAGYRFGVQMMISALPGTHLDT